MNTEIDTAETTELDDSRVTTAEIPAAMELNTTTPGTLLKMPLSGQSADSPEWLEVVEKSLQLLAIFPDLLGKILGEYRSPLSTVGLVLVAGLGVAVADGVLARLNAIPLFAPVFELIGLGFTGWVVVRYLLYAETRQELLTEYHQIKARIAGHKA